MRKYFNIFRRFMLSVFFTDMIDAMITERIVMFHEGLVSDGVIYRARPGIKFKSAIESDIEYRKIERGPDKKIWHRECDDEAFNTRVFELHKIYESKKTSGLAMEQSTMLRAIFHEFCSHDPATLTVTQILDIGDCVFQLIMRGNRAS